MFLNIIWLLLVASQLYSSQGPVVLKQEGEVADRWLNLQTQRFLESQDIKAIRGAILSHQSKMCYVPDCPGCQARAKRIEDLEFSLEAGSYKILSPSYKCQSQLEIFELRAQYDNCLQRRQ